MGLGSVVQWQTKDVLPQSILFVLTPGVASLKEGHLIEAARLHHLPEGHVSELEGNSRHDKILIKCLNPEVFWPCRWCTLQGQG